ncbi:DNA-binding transcriptional regulator [Actimicrobium antarcticum]|uniref:DNA-binding transcriptional regulator n=1 Tax=Actimicrobium antarcticum TaxID=1051899 RepID=A0ABP7TIM4_9BURK
MNDDAPDTQYKTLRGLTRGLDLLRVLNAVEHGRASIADLSSGTGLHRATVRRLLETFIADGYVRRSESDDRYQLTLKVRELSEGFTDVEWISKISTPIMGELMQKVVWPSDLSTLSGDAMIIRETTHRFSPLSFHRSMVGRRLPILLTASGRAYFAFCGDDEREQIVQMLRSQDDEQGRLAADARFTANLVKRVRADGFSSNEGDWATEKKVGAIALPVISQGRVVACLNIIYLSRALSTKDAVRKYGSALQEAVTKITNQMDASQHD